MKGATFLAVVFIFLVSPGGLTPQDVAQDELMKQAPKVYLDCKISTFNDYQACDHDYFKTEMPFVNYVRDRKEADVHILITTQTTASSGSEFTISFIGQQRFAGMEDTLTYYSNQQDSVDTVRAGLVRTIKAGLIRYISRTPMIGKLQLSFENKMKTEEVKDKWNYWVFSLSGSGYMSGQKLRKYAYLYGDFFARRITPKMKLNLDLYASYDYSHYEWEEEGVPVVSKSAAESYGFDGLVVFSLGDHWSVGGYAAAESSTFSNIRIMGMLSPAVEFNLFKYQDSTRKQLRFLYKLGGGQYHYNEETIFDKTKEFLFSHSLLVSLAVKQPWGSAGASISGSNYLHDFSKYRVNLSGSLELKVLKGVSFSVSGNYAFVHDQLSLSKAMLTPEEVLLQRKQLATTYSYFISIGLSYTFGSIYSNVVNPRFGGSSSSTMIIIN